MADLQSGVVPSQYGINADEVCLYVDELLRGTETGTPVAENTVQHSRVGQVAEQVTNESNHMTAHTVQEIFQAQIVSLDPNVLLTVMQKSDPETKRKFQEVFSEGLNEQIDTRIREQLSGEEFWTLFHQNVDRWNLSTATAATAATAETSRSRGRCATQPMFCSELCSCISISCFQSSWRSK